MEYGFGWKRDRPDSRDLLFVPKLMAVTLSDVDLRPKMPKIFDQGELGSCTANASTAVLEYAEKKQGDKDWDRLSRLEVYYRSRELEGTTGEDAGAELRDSFKVLGKWGAARERFWPYDISKFAVAPPDSLARSDRYHRALEYRSVASSATDMIGCLNEGFPFAFGFDVYESFYGVTPSNPLYNPGPGEQYVGGHAVVCVGFSLARNAWIVRNSWSSDWGENGHFYVPVGWMQRNAFDAWTVTKTT